MENTYTYWFYRWPLWLRAAAIIFLFPIFVPILVWPFLKTTLAKTLFLTFWVVLWIIVGASTPKAPSTSETHNANSTSSSQSKASSSQASTVGSTSSSASIQTSDTTATYIPGLQPVDVYLNFEKQGFETKKSLGGDYGSSWVSTSSEIGIDYTVEVYSEKDITKVSSVKATALLNGSVEKDITAVKPFIKYASSLPYTNADPSKAAQWIEDNFNNDKASTVIGGVKFEIFSPTQLVRIMRISLP